MRTLLTFAAIVLLAATMAAAAPIKVLIITGDHGHNWKETTPFLKEMLTKAGHEVDLTERPRVDLISANLARYDVLLLNYRNTPRGAMANPDSVWNEDNQRASPKRCGKARAWWCSIMRRRRLPAAANGQGIRKDYRGRLAELGK